MRAHHATPCGDAGGEHCFHNRMLVSSGWKEDMEALPIGFGVGTIDRTGNAGNGGELHTIELGQVPPLFYHCRNALQLLATDRRLDVGQAVVETDLVIALEYDAAGGMALTVGHRHA